MVFRGDANGVSVHVWRAGKGRLGLLLLLALLPLAIPTRASPVLVSLAVTPASPSIAAGTTELFTATGTYSDRSTKVLTTAVTWSSSASSVATINWEGLAASVAAGTTTISATLGSVTGSATLTVGAAVVKSLAFSAASAPPGATITATVTLTGDAASGGLPVSLSSTLPGVIAAPASVTVPEGRNKQSFAVIAGQVAASTAVTVTASSGGSAVSGTLTVLPGLSASVSSVAFGGTLDTMTSSPESFKLTNNSSASVALTSIGASSAFEQANTCPATLAAGATCNIVVMFTPPSAGSFSGSATIISTAANMTLTVTLTGTGMHWVGLTWTDSDPTITGYNVYRGTVSGGPYGTKVNGSDAIISRSYADADPALVPGTAYYYVVTALNAAGESAKSNQAQVTFP